MNRKLWQNLVSLYGTQLLTYAVQLISLPFLARQLGPAAWGKLACAEAFAGYTAMVVEYGFGFSGTREMAQVRSDPEKRATLLAGVVGAQLLLIAAAFVTAIAAGLWVNSFAVFRALIPLAFLLGAFRAVTPFWYFQGVERMPLVASMNVAANVTALTAILIWVRSPKDLVLVLIFRCLAAFACSSAGFVIAYRETAFLPPTLRDAWGSLRIGWTMFLFMSTVSLYTTANVLLLGTMASPVVVAWFAGGERIAKTASMAVGPITQAFYPRISNLLAKDLSEAARLARISAVLTIGAGLMFGLVLFTGAPLVVRLLLGAGFTETIPVLRVLAFLPPITAGSTLLGIQWMLPMRMDREFNTIIVLAGAINLLLAFTLVPRFQHVGMAASVVLAEAFVTGAILVVLWKRRLGPWMKVLQQEVIAA